MILLKQRHGNLNFHWLACQTRDACQGLGLSADDYPSPHVVDNARQLGHYIPNLG